MRTLEELYARKRQLNNIQKNAKNLERHTDKMIAFQEEVRNGENPPVQAGPPDCTQEENLKAVACGIVDDAEMVKDSYCQDLEDCQQGGS
jgi:hypothetical protein